MPRDPKHILFNLEQDQFSPRGLWLLAVLYFGSIAAGAALGLAAFQLTHYLDPDASSYLAQKPYSRFFDRARWFSVLIILPFLFQQCRLYSWSGIGFARPWKSTLLQWFAYGIMMILLIYGGQMSMGAVTLDHAMAWSLSDILGAAAEALLAASLIASLEEIVFRGLVFRMFYTAMRPVPAIFASSFFFAALHFKAPSIKESLVDPSAIGIGEAVATAWGAAVSIVLHFDLTYLLTICLVGIVLHQVFLLSGSLWASIGIHAGWVFTIKFAGEFLQNTGSANAFSGTLRVADGYWVSIPLLVFAAVFAFLLHRRNSRTPLIHA